MNKAIIINFNLDGDIQQLMYAYQERIDCLSHMINKLEENSYKSDNSREIAELKIDRFELEQFVKKLESI